MDNLKKALLLPLKVIWFILAWPCILGWKVFKFLLKNPIFKTGGTGGGGNNLGGELVSAGLGVVLLFAIPLTTWVGIFFGIQHFCGNHGKNFVCGWLDEKRNQEVQFEENTVPSVPSEEVAAPNADTNSVVELEQPATE